MLDSIVIIQSAGALLWAKYEEIVDISVRLAGSPITGKLKASMCCRHSHSQWRGRSV